MKKVFIQLVGIHARANPAGLQGAHGGAVAQMVTFPLLLDVSANHPMTILDVGDPNEPREMPRAIVHYNGAQYNVANSAAGVLQLIAEAAGGAGRVSIVTPAPPPASAAQNGAPAEAPAAGLKIHTE